MFVASDTGVIVLQYPPANLDVDLATLSDCVYNDGSALLEYKGKPLSI